jgi:hypothetical protein
MSIKQRVRGAVSAVDPQPETKAKAQVAIAIDEPKRIRKVSELLIFERKGEKSHSNSDGAMLGTDGKAPAIFAAARG